MSAPSKEEMMGLSKSALRSVRFFEGVKEHIDKKHLLDVICVEPKETQ